MAEGYWFGVAGSKSLAKTDLTNTWWCLPYSAEKGDRVLLYCPRSISQARHGVFAEARVLVPPDPTREENCRCSTYGFFHKAGLGYVEIEIVERFAPRLAARHMKRDPLLMHTAVVRRNFQGTTFSIDLGIYEQIKRGLAKLASDDNSTLQLRDGSVLLPRQEEANVDGCESGYAEFWDAIQDKWRKI